MSKQKVSSIQKKLLLLLIPLFSFAFIVLLVVNSVTNTKTLTEAAERTLREESSSNVQSLTIDMLTTIGAPSITSAYVQLSERALNLFGMYNKVENLSIMDCGYAFLVNTDSGMIVAHSDPQIKNTYLTDLNPNSFLGQAVKFVNDRPNEEGEQPIHILRDGNTGYYVIAQPFAEIPWVLISCLPQSYVTKELISLNINLVIIALFMLILTAVLVSIVVKRMMAPIKRLTGTLTDIADGDFTMDIRISGNDEITVMSRALKEFVTIMREVILDIREVSNQLNDHSASTKKVSDTLSGTSQTQAESMGEMQVTLDQVAAAISDLAQHATTLARVVDTTNQEGSAANDKMRQAVNIASKGRNDMVQVSENMDTIVNSMRNLSTVVSEVGTSTQKINSIVQLIQEISEQTNLLSLNAAIEAARAGEAGRGFSVVAEEINKLADISASSAAQIANIIESVNNQVSNMVTRAEESVTYIEDNSAMVTASCELFERIYQDLSSSSKELSNIVDQIHNVDDVASNIAALSQEQSASTEEILASTHVLAEDALHVSEESRAVADSADAVAQAAFTLAEHMRRFRI